MADLRTRMRKIWGHIKDRCYRKTDKSYPNYGGRGISVCERWLESFDNFLEDVSKLPNFGKEGYSLNRIDNDGNYEPNNVEWADWSSQQNNKRSNRVITYNGKTQTLGQWCKELGLNYKLVWLRMYRFKWNAEDAFTNKKYPQYHKREGSSCEN